MILEFRVDGRTNLKLGSYPQSSASNELVVFLEHDPLGHVPIDNVQSEIEDLRA